MDATQIDATAARLAALGCEPYQIARHIKRLTAIAATRASKPARRQRRAPAELGEDQLIDLLAKLRERPYRWAVRRHAGIPWVGHAVAAVLGQPLPSRSQTADFVVGDALRQLTSA